MVSKVRIIWKQTIDATVKVSAEIAAVEAKIQAAQEQLQRQQEQQRKAAAAAAAALKVCAVVFRCLLSSRVASAVD